MNLDILVFAAHPDDAELACGGTIAKQVQMGYKVGMVDLTLGELGTRGNVEIRLKEAKAAAEILGLSVRGNLELPDGYLQSSDEQVIKVIQTIRAYKPKIVICGAVQDRHPDHKSGSDIVSRACFMSGLSKIETRQEAWRPSAVYHYIQDRYIKPDFIVDISEFWDIKCKAIAAHKSQFFDPNSKEPLTYISSPDFMKYIEARSIEYGHQIHTRYGEGFTIERPIGIKNISDLI